MALSFKKFDETNRNLALQKNERTYISTKACRRCGSHSRNVRTYGCYPCELQTQKNNYHNKSPTDKLKRKSKQLQRTYGIDLTEYERMMAEQKNCCAICGEIRSNDKYFAVDHCHTTLKVRGLLCSTCNTSLYGLEYFLNEEKNLLLSAINYLGKHKWR